MAAKRIYAAEADPDRMAAAMRAIEDQRIQARAERESQPRVRTPLRTLQDALDAQRRQVRAAQRAKAEWRQRDLAAAVERAEQQQQRTVQWRLSAATYPRLQQAVGRLLSIYGRAAQQTVAPTRTMRNGVWTVTYEVQEDNND